MRSMVDGHPVRDDAERSHEVDKKMWEKKVKTFCIRPFC